MAKGRFSYYPLAIAAVFILLEAVSLVMLKRSSTLQDIWLNRLSHNVMGKLWGGGESIRNHFSLQKQNDALREENFRLSERLRTYELGGRTLRDFTHFNIYDMAEEFAPERAASVTVS